MPDTTGLNKAIRLHRKKLETLQTQVKQIQEVLAILEAELSRKLTTK